MQLNCFAANLLIHLLNQEPKLLSPPQAYLQKYGYMNESMGSANLISESSFKEAIRIFQRFVGLNETGNLDQNTVRMMSQPRCGNRDRIGGSGEEARRRRYALQGESHQFL